MIDRVVIETVDLTKDYAVGSHVVRALRGINVAIQRGEFVAIMGPSGSGKSTFMNLVGCLDRPTSGRYLLNGTDVSSLSRDELARIRNRTIGFVFQTFNLLPRTTALDNVALPLSYSAGPAEDPRERARRALEAVGLTEFLDHRPSQLSGGQQQRVAIARAVINDPAVVLADEPTGNLDSRTGVEILSLFQAMNRRGMTLVLVTHEADIAQYASRILSFRDGRLRDDRPVHDRLDAEVVLQGLEVEFG